MHEILSSFLRDALAEQAALASLSLLRGASPGRWLKSITWRLYKYYRTGTDIREGMACTCTISGNSDARFSAPSARSSSAYCVTGRSPGTSRGARCPTTVRVVVALHGRSMATGKHDWVTPTPSHFSEARSVRAMR